MLSYFDNLEFVHHGYKQRSIAKADRKVFDGYYVVQLIFEGRVYAKFGDGPEEIGEGPLAFITYPGIPISYGSVGNTSREHMFLAFRGERVEQYIKSELIELRQSHYFIPVCQPEKLRQICLQIFTYIQNWDSLSNHAHAVLSLEELLLLLKIQNMETRPNNSPYRHLLETLRGYLNSHPEKKWDFRQEAARLCVSYPHFCRIFHDFTGMPPQKYHQKSQVLMAQKLLTSTSLRMDDIAEQCGFQNAFYLYRTFKRHTGLSPMAFRKRFGLFD